MSRVFLPPDSVPAVVDQWANLFIFGWNGFCRFEPFWGSSFFLLCDGGESLLLYVMPKMVA
jgi:hypothetical protein